MESYLKFLHEIYAMTKKLPDKRFNSLLRLFWGGVLAAYGYVIALLITAIRWW